MITFPEMHRRVLALSLLLAATLALAAIPVLASPDALGSGATDLQLSQHSIAALQPTASPTATSPVSPTASLTVTATVSPTLTTAATPSYTPTATATVAPSQTPCPTWTPRPYDFQADVQVHGNLIRGRTIPNGQVSAALHDPSGALAAQAEATAEANGDYVLAFVDGTGDPIETMPDWRVQVTGPNGSADISPPHLSLIIELSGGRLQGEGPPNTDLWVISSYSGGVRSVRTDSSGRFSEIWLPEREGVVGPWGEVFLDLPGGHHVFARDRILSLSVEIDSKYVKVTGPAMSHLSVSVERGGPGRFLLGTAAGAASGWGERIFGIRHQATREDLPIVPGMRVIATSKKVPEVEHVFDPVPELTGKVAPGGKAVVGWTEPNIPVRARLYWPPDPLDPCQVTYAERMGFSKLSGAFSVALESGTVGLLPRPLEDVDRLVIAYRSPFGDEVWSEISTEYGEISHWLYLPLLKRDPAR